MSPCVISSHLLQMRGLKPGSVTADTPVAMSHLLQMRGLKPSPGGIAKKLLRSHLLQMRGLKPKWLTYRERLDCRIFYRCVD